MRLPMMPKPIKPIFISIPFSGCGHQLRFPNASSFDLRNLFIRKTKCGRVDVSFNLLGVARTDDGTGHRRISQRPGDSDLTGRTLNPFADFSQALNEREILRQPRLAKLDVAASPVTGGESC